MGSNLLPKPFSDILTEVSMIHDCSAKVAKLDFYVQSLEEERKKVEAFEHQLPLSVILLQEAMEFLRKEMLKWKGKEIRRPPVTEEFIPLKSGGGGGGGGDGRGKWSNEITTDRKNWMSSVQLWSTPIHYENHLSIPKSQDSVLSLKPRHEEEEGGSGGFNFKNIGGAFLPFHKASPSPSPSLPTKKRDRDRDRDVVLPEEVLSLSMPAAQVEPLDLNTVRPPAPPPLPNAAQKKQRRCWTPELHTKFVDALQLLGGPQDATPKQIRERMKVKDLTNDEVKSHLQKYRMHIKRLPNHPLAAQPNNDLSWPTNDHQGDPSKRTAGSSASPQDHLHGGGSAKGGSASMEEEEEEEKSETTARSGRKLN
ncbi:transcription factor HHO5-like [Andrographis paniculata]|uniref:transcription factor HHO5-like n=1 Tax=Andrographis paniculata TaxID=175694 RepID=UPI0021E82249|nr:transcription factor HHO5-like [Andrographis paniculata]